MKIYVVPDPNETKFQRFKREAKAKRDEIGDWLDQNKEAVLALTPIAFVGVTAFIKAASKRANLHKEEAVKNLYCYDRHLGHYWRLRRELSNDEWLAIDHRTKSGERLSDILSELKVLK